MDPIVTYSRPTMNGYYVIVDDVLYRLPHGDCRRKDDDFEDAPENLLSLLVGDRVSPAMIEALWEFKEE